MVHFQMINVAEKQVTFRRALARGTIQLSDQVFAKVVSRSLPKGDVLALAEVAAIQGVKLTGQILPLCHPLEISGVKTRCLPESEKKQIMVECEVSCNGRTGVEMEALAGVMAGLLCVHDLTKMFDPASMIGGVHLVRKEGGKNGVWEHPSASSASSALPVTSVSEVTLPLQGVKAVAISVGDTAYHDNSLDRTGPFLRNALEEGGAQDVELLRVPDEKRVLQDVLNTHLGRCQLIVLTGGTGVGPRDVTRESVEELLEGSKGYEVMGVGEMLRAKGAEQTQMSWLSRSGCFCVRGTLVLCLPGSLSAVKHGVSLVFPLIPHMLSVRNGLKHGHLKS
jgi:cyclic pyranopterin monophosphate synthase